MRFKDSIFFFAVIVDGTQDIPVAEKETICIRYVDEDLSVREVFVGLYSVSPP